MSPRSVVLSALLVVALVAVPLSGASVAAPTADHDVPSYGTVDFDATATPALSGVESAPPEAAANRTAAPSTNDTIGYVNGYWHDDELDVDAGSLTAEELDAVVYRSMARVELIRELPFEEAVPVEVVPRDEYEAETEGRFQVSADERLRTNAEFEALFMVDRETDAVEEYRAFFGGAVAGYYDTRADRIVIVSDDVDEPAMDELTLGHELTHALQDQHFDLSRYDGETRDGDTAEKGLIEGDANWVEYIYEGMCEESWDCVLPSEEEPDAPEEEEPDDPEDGDSSASDLHYGIHFMLYQPYSDGPSFIQQLRDEGNWTAVNAAYDDPPASSSAVIRPEEYGDRAPIDITHEDESTDRWSRLDPGTGPDHQRFGEAGIASMFVYPTLETSPIFGGEELPETVDEELISLFRVFNFVGGDLEIFDFDPYNYDHRYSDGWAGDKFVPYVTDEETVDEMGYVWHTEWLSENDAAEFVEGYTWLLAYHGADPVDGHENVYVVEEGYPGAYYVDHDGASVDVVRAPSPAELSEIGGESVPAIDDGNETDTGEEESDTGDEGDEDEGSDDGEDEGNDEGEGNTDGSDTDGSEGSDTDDGEENADEDDETGEDGEEHEDGKSDENGTDENGTDDGNADGGEDGADVDEGGVDVDEDGTDDDPEAGVGADDVSGFGPIVALGALAAVSLALVRRR